MYGQYNPYMGATPQMQQRLNYLQQQQQQMYQPTMQQPMTLKGRIVTSMDEAKAAQIDLDGTSTFFPCPAEGKIYEKLIGLDGLPIFRVYQINNSQISTCRGVIFASSNTALKERRVEVCSQSRVFFSSVSILLSPTYINKKQ